MDNRTLGMALMIVAIAVAALGILMARGRKDPAMTLWTWGFVFVVPGFGLLSLQGTVSPWFSIILANLLAMGFHFFMAAGMRAFSGGQALWPLRFWGYYGLWTAFLLYFTFILDSYLARAVGASLLIILLTAEVLLNSREKSCPNLPPYARRFVQGSLLAFCTGHGLRILGLLLFPGTSLLGDQRVTSFFFILSLAYSIIWPGLIWLLDSHRLLEQQAALSRVKDRIWKMAGHDLRGPLGSLEQYLDILAQPDGGEHCIDKDDIILMKSSVKEVNNLLENILDMARAQTSADSSGEPFDVNPYIHAVCSTWTPAARLKDITLRISTEEKLQAKGGPEAFQGALRNLVSNAIKFSPRGSEVEITSYLEDSWLVLKVRDKGPGLDPSTLEAFTKNNVPLPKRRGTVNEGGSGFGLILVKELTASLGGLLEVRNHPSGGAEFLLKFPSP